MTNRLTTSGLFGTLLADDAIAAEFGAAAFLARMLEFESAWTQALATLEVISAEAAQKAQTRIAGFGTRDLSSGSDADGLPVPLLVAQLRAGLSPDDSAAVHSGATSQDVIDTAMVLSCLAVLDRLAPRLQDLCATIRALEQKSGHRPMMARTRMQAALPATALLRLSAWRNPLEGHLARLDSLRQEVGHVQVGGAIGLRDAPAGHGQEIARRVANQLGLSLGPVWHSDRSGFVAFGHWLTLVAGSLGKIGQDIALMAQQGVDEIALSGGGGSSAMPHKQNPVRAELMVTLGRFVAGQQGVLAQAMIHEQERSGAAWALEWMTLPLMAEATGAALRHGTLLMSSIERVGRRDE